MIGDRLQLWLDQAAATCGQRWWLGGAAVASILAATLTITIGATEPRLLALVVGVTTLLAVVAVAGSGSHTGSIVIVLVALAWIALIDDPTTPRSIAIASCLYLFHALLALMAATRHTAPIHPQILWRWATRSVAVLAATAGVWVCVVWFEGRQHDDNAVLTLLALIVIALGVLALRRHALEPTGCHD